MAKSTKPRKPDPDYPLFAHQNGRWAKKVNGRLYYFGVWGDPQAAVERWLVDKDAILAGRVPVSGDALTLSELCNHYLAHKKQLLESGELQETTFSRNLRSAKFLTEQLGRDRTVESLRPEDFTVLRAVMAKKWGPVALGNEIQTVRSMIPISIVDVEEGWLDYPRAKTAIDRRIPLWPETCKALKHVIFERREPVNEEDSELLFIGKRGQNYVGGRKGYRVTQEFDRVARRAGVVGRSFYDFRRTFETIAGEGGDQVAVDHIMGHAPGGNDMGAVYRQRISADRLLAVTNTVRAWLYGDDVVSLDESIALRVVG